MQIYDIYGNELYYFAGANLRRADLRDANLRRADFRDADLRDADLRGADIRGADFRGADLSGTDLRGALGIKLIIPETSCVPYYIVMTDTHIKICCEYHTIEEWFAFDDRSIVEMDGKDALKFWRVWRPILLQLSVSG